MKKQVKNWILAIALLGCWQSGNAQFLFIDGTFSRPESFAGTGSFRDLDGTGIYAKNGGGLNIEMMGAPNIIGFGGSFSFSIFGMNTERFMQDMGAIDITKSGSISSVKFGIGPVLQVPLIDDMVYWNLKLYGGFRFLSAPQITLFYSPLDNRYLEVNYATKGNVGVHYEIGTGFTIMFNEKLGVNLAASYVQGPITRIGYDISAKGSKLFEGSDALYQSINYMNFRIGLAINL